MSTMITTTTKVNMFTWQRQVKAWLSQKKYNPKGTHSDPEREALTIVEVPMGNTSARCKVGPRRRWDKTVQLNCPLCPWCLHGICHPAALHWVTENQCSENVHSYSAWDVQTLAPAISSDLMQNGRLSIYVVGELYHSGTREEGLRADLTGGY